MNDLLIKGGTLVDPAEGIHGCKDVAFAGGRGSRWRTTFPQGRRARSSTPAA